MYLIKYVFFLMFKQETLGAKEMYHIMSWAL